MPATSLTVKTEQDITIKPTVRKKLLTALRTYAELRVDLKAIEAAMDKQKGTIGAIREEIGEQSLGLEGFTVTLVAGVRSTLDKAKLIAQGVTVAQIEAATTTKPTKPYTKITVPGQRDGHED